MRPLELLAPARDLSTAREAILHGADAIYIGAPSHGARCRATNSLDDIRQLVDFAAPYGVKVYVTVNTIIFDDELADVERMIAYLYRIGVDALIVQDTAILRMNIPPIELHASTQMDTRNAAKARMLQSLGFSQIVVARELNIQELKEVCNATDVPVEAFVHGALCVSYSGDCQASYVNNGRSANRGNCAQMCRLPYDLIDSEGRTIARQKHFLSLRDLNRIESLAQMAEAGVASFKIEGRLKDPSYVKNVVAAYRQQLDKIIAANPDKYYRPSRGQSVMSFTPDLRKSFNRGYTDYFFTKPQRGSLATFDSPKAVGELVGEVRSCNGKLIEFNHKSTDKTASTLSNGDGLTYITPDGISGGFRANRIEGRRIHLFESLQLPNGTQLYRSYDRQWEESMERPTATRLIPISLTARLISHKPSESGNNATLVLDGDVNDIGTISVSIDIPYQKSEKPDNGYRERTLRKFGNTIFSIEHFTDLVGDAFIPASVLSELRRKLIDALMLTLSATKRRTYRRKPEAEIANAPAVATRHDNISNSMAREFYESIGCKVAEPALEANKQLPLEDLRVMTTRYCLRRELGACLKEASGKNLKSPLWLRGAGFSYRLDFDCKNCQMHVIAPSNTH